MKNHVLFDVLPDDIATPDKLARYKRILRFRPCRSWTPNPMKGSAVSKHLRAFACLPESGKGRHLGHSLRELRPQRAGEKEAKGFIADENPIAVPESGLTSLLHVDYRSARSSG